MTLSPLPQPAFEESAEDEQPTQDNRIRPTLAEPALEEAATLEARLHFAERSLTNVHELNRFMDQKASFILFLVAALATVLVTLAAAAFNSPTTDPVLQALKVLAAVSMLVYMGLALRVLYSASRVYRSVSEMIRPDTNAPGLLFPLLLLKRYQSDEDRYLKRLSSSSLQDLLHDYAHEIVEVSRVYSDKEQHINLSFKWLGWMSLSWALAALLLLSVIAHHNWG